MPIVTIDGETARDFDDAVWVERRERRRVPSARAYRGRELLREAGVADRRGGAAARHQRLLSRIARCPMLPFELSTDVCSLVPHEDRLVVSALMEIDRNGGLLQV